MNKNELVGFIEEVFAGVTIGDSCSLREAELEGQYGMNRGVTLKEREMARSKDVLDNWKNIAYEDIRDISAPFSFLTDEGFRYYIPAYMIGTLSIMESQDYSPFDTPLCTVFALTYRTPGTYRPHQFKILDDMQIQAVTRFLEYIIKDYKEYKYDILTAREALQLYWHLPADKRPR